MKTKEKKYLGTWGEYPIGLSCYGPCQRMIIISDITEDVGYSKEEIQAIQSLRMGEVWISDQGGHTIKRVSKKEMEYFSLDSGIIVKGERDKCFDQFMKKIKAKGSRAENWNKFQVWAKKTLPKIKLPNQGRHPLLKIQEETNKHFIEMEKMKSKRA